MANCRNEKEKKKNHFLQNHSFTSSSSLVSSRVQDFLPLGYKTCETCAMDEGFEGGEKGFSSNLSRRITYASKSHPLSSSPQELLRRRRRLGGREKLHAGMRRKKMTKPPNFRFLRRRGESRDEIFLPPSSYPLPPIFFSRFPVTIGRGKRDIRTERDEDDLALFQ